MKKRVNANAEPSFYCPLPSNHGAFGVPPSELYPLLAGFMVRCPVTYSLRVSHSSTLSYLCLQGRWNKSGTGGPSSSKRAPKSLGTSLGTQRSTLGHFNSIFQYFSSLYSYLVQSYLAYLYSLFALCCIISMSKKILLHFKKGTFAPHCSPK